MKLTFLGTGTSFGIPVVGCDCAACTSEDPRDRRTRTGALVTFDDGRKLLVDTPPELRLQLVAAGVEDVDAVWMTHVHADHVHGIDDLRIFTGRSGRALPVHIHASYAAELERRFQYIFDASRPPRGTTKPRLRLVPFDGAEEIDVAGHTLRPLPVPHGPATVWGFRAGPLGFVTDGKRLPRETLAALVGVDVLVLNALWFGYPHPTHFNVEEAVAAARSVGASRTLLIHLTHRVRHEELLERLPEGVEPAYDGLTIEL